MKMKRANKSRPRNRRKSIKPCPDGLQVPINKNENSDKSEILSDEQEPQTPKFKDFLVFFCESIVSFALWVSVLCLGAILLVAIRQKNSQATVEILYFAPPFYQTVVLIYICLLLILGFFRNTKEVAENIFSSQVKQLYFSIPILASLIFLTIDRVN